MSGACKECESILDICDGCLRTHFKQLEKQLSDLQEKYDRAVEVARLYAEGMIVKSDYSEVTSVTRFHATGINRKNSTNGEFETTENRFGKKAREFLKSIEGNYEKTN